MEKNILVVAATTREILPLIRQLREAKPGQPVPDLLISGIGLTATAYHLTRQLSIKKYDLVIQAGVAGSFDSRLALGDVVAIKQDTVADQSVIELKKLKTLFDLKLVPHNRHPFQQGWLINPYKNILKQSQLQTVNGISVNQITTSPEALRFYNSTFHPVTESMEGAALHYVCLMERVPFLQIRSISNYVGERNKKNWNLKSAVENLNTCLFSLITSFS